MGGRRGRVGFTEVSGKGKGGKPRGKKQKGEIVMDGKVKKGE